MTSNRAVFPPLLFYLPCSNGFILLDFKCTFDQKVVYDACSGQSSKLSNRASRRTMLARQEGIKPTGLPAVAADLRPVLTLPICDQRPVRLSIRLCYLLGSRPATLVVKEHELLQAPPSATESLPRILRHYEAYTTVYC
jgi:hypothetical protein